MTVLDKILKKNARIQKVKLLCLKICAFTQKKQMKKNKMKKFKLLENLLESLPTYIVMMHLALHIDRIHQWLVRDLKFAVLVS